MRNCPNQFEQNLILPKMKSQPPLNLNSVPQFPFDPLTSDQIQKVFCFLLILQNLQLGSKLARHNFLVFLWKKWIQWFLLIFFLFPWSKGSPMSCYVCIKIPNWVSVFVCVRVCNRLKSQNSSLGTTFIQKS